MKGLIHIAITIALTIIICLTMINSGIDPLSYFITLIALIAYGLNAFADGYRYAKKRKGRVEV
jgi:hypothetical protein